MKSLLIAIDVQKDFHDVTGATLPVTGSSKDTERLSKFVDNVHLDAIVASLDSHLKNDISHSSWWKDHTGALVKPFTLISSEDIKEGKYVPRIDPKRSLKYVEDLEKNGEFKHCIWTDHCLIGSEGQALMPIFMEALNNWSQKNLGWVNFINKGANPYTEHFGIFRANVPMVEDPNTQVNQGLFQHLNTFDVLYLGGQARTHCDINSLKQLLEIAPQLAPKIVVLEDCMSDVLGLPTDFYVHVDNLYNDAKSKGVQFAKSTDI